MPAVKLSAAEDLAERTWWDSWNRSHRTSDRNDPVSSELFERTAALINRLSPAGGGRVLEVGCGTGTLSRLLECSAYFGIDLSAAAVDIARSKTHLGRSAGASWTYEAADVHEWTPPAEAFDMVVCVDAVAYFYDQQRALRKMAGVLAPSGRLVLTTINPFVYSRIRRTAGSPLKEGAVSRWLRKGDLHGLLASAGLRIEQSFTVMPRGNMGILRILNAPRLQRAIGRGATKRFDHVKEVLGLGQYRVVVARK